jgi:hypothetical protein
VYGFFAISFPAAQRGAAGRGRRRRRSRLLDRRDVALARADGGLERQGLAAADAAVDGTVGRRHPLADAQRGVGAERAVDARAQAVVAEQALQLLDVGTPHGALQGPRPVRALGVRGVCGDRYDCAHGQHGHRP